MACLSSAMVVWYCVDVKTGLHSGIHWANKGLIGGLLGLLTACSAATHLVTHTVFETPTRFVRLAVDRTVSLKSEFSHPVTIHQDRMSALLAGLIVVEPTSLIPWPFQEERLSRHSLFREEEIRLLAPLLAKALEEATSEEVVTFYQADVISPVRRDVTSGGLFVKDEYLHFILSNYRAPAQFIADIGMADTHDDRRNPLRATAPQQVKLQFELEELVAAQEETHTVGRIPRARTVAVLFRQLPSRSLSPTSDQDNTSSVPLSLDPGRASLRK
jgi:hypothetical protein